MLRQTNTYAFILNGIVRSTHANGDRRPVANPLTLLSKHPSPDVHTFLSCNKCKLECNRAINQRYALWWGWLHAATSGLKLVFPVRSSLLTFTAHMYIYKCWKMLDFLPSGLILPLLASQNKPKSVQWLLNSTQNLIYRPQYLSPWDFSLHSGWLSQMKAHSTCLLFYLASAAHKCTKWLLMYAHTPNNCVLIAVDKAGRELAAAAVVQCRSERSGTDSCHRANKKRESE